MKRPSIFYRIKSKQGEELYLLIVTETFGEDDYNVIINGALQLFRFNLKSFKKKMQVSHAVKLCSKKLSSEDFIVNKCNGPDNKDCQNMCDFILKLYGNINKNV